MRHYWSKVAIMLLGLACLVGIAHVALAGVKDDYKTPTVTVPYAWNNPVIDGVVNDAEWQGAVSFNALQTVSHDVSIRQARFWMLWDEDNLYLAMRSPLRPGERIVQSMRQHDKDINVVFDDSYEIWMDLGTNSPDGQPVFFQYLCNYAAAKLDAMHEPAVGNMRMGWTAGWQPKNRITPDGQTWEMEMVIPRKSMYMNKPFTDGATFNCMIARNFKRPWEQNSFEGTGIFNVRDTYSHYHLSKTAPAVQLLGVNDLKNFGLALAFNGQRDETVKWSFASDGGVTKSGDVAVKKGQTVTLPPALNLDTPGQGSFRITVTAQDGTPYFDWCANRNFGGSVSDIYAPMQDRNDVVSLALQFNPIQNYIRVTGDFIGYDTRNDIARSVVRVEDAQGKQLAEQAFTIDALAYVSGVLKLADLPAGDYLARMICYDKNDKIVLTRESKFNKKDPAKAFPWWNTTVGNIEKVISPWTPVTYTNGAFGIWGRTMNVGAAGLLTQITSQQIPLLAGPMKLVAEMADGKLVTATGVKSEVVSKADHRTVIKVTSNIGAIQVVSLVTVEFDGMYKVDMTLTPQQAIAIKSLKLVVPYQNSVADYLYGKGEGIRAGFDYRFLPKAGKGRIWDSLKVDSQPMAVGSFIPYIWVGNPKGGLCWFADSDQGWVPNDQTPALEMRRDTTASSDLIFNFISAPYTLDKPRTITFAFEASPVKAMHEGWRMDTWWCGDTFRDYACVQDKGGSLIFTSIPFTLNPEKCRQMVEAQHQGSAVFGLPKYRANAVAYFEHVNIGEAFVPEMAYFGDEWRAHGLYYGKTFTDFMIYSMGNWAKDCGIDGFYVDNVNPQSDDNIDAGRGYLLPDGRIQPSYQMFDLRKYFLRMRAAFAEAGKNNKIIFHATNNLILPWAGAADIYFDGENNVIYPEMGKDFMDFWSLERLRLNFPEQSGVAGNFLQEYQGSWDGASMHKVMRAYTGMMILHDVLPSGNCNGLNPEVFQARDRFGIEANDVHFLGYWDKNSGVGSATPDMYTATWVRPQKLLIAVVNKGENAAAVVQIDTVKLGLPAPTACKVWDAETMQELSMNARGEVTIPIERHDYREFIIEKR